MLKKECTHRITTVLPDCSQCYLMQPLIVRVLRKEFLQEFVWGSVACEWWGCVQRKLRCVNLNAPFSSETIRRDCRCVNDRPWKWVLVLISRFASFSCPREVCRNWKSSCVIYVSGSETVCPLSCKLFVAAVCYCNQTTLPHNRQMCVLPWCFNGHEHLTCEAGCAVRVWAQTTCMEMCSWVFSFYVDKV